jgi:putative flippase GtrA
VTYARALYERFRHLIHEVAKFGVVGAFAFLVTEVGTNLLHFQAALGPLVSNVIATGVAACVSFAGNRYWTFRHRDRSGLGREYLIFFVLNAIGLVIQLACLGFAYYVLAKTDKLSYNVALFVGIVLGTLFRFWSYRVWVWRAVPAEDAAGVAGLPETVGRPAAAPQAAAFGPAGTVWPNGSELPQANGYRMDSPAPAPPVSDGNGVAGRARPAGTRSGGGRHARPR